MQSSTVAALRTRLAELLPPASPDVLPTDLHELDWALGGGLPRGRMTELAGPLGSGTATLARRLVAGIVGRGLGVAYVDASRTLDPFDWAAVGGEYLRMVRPPQAERGAWCADVLLRSGAFVLVVLDGAPPLTRQQAVRLTGLAREKDAAFVVVGEGSVSAVRGAVRLALRRRWGAAPARRSQGLAVGARGAASPGAANSSHAGAGGISLLVERGGARELVELPAGIEEVVRLRRHGEIADRRGVGRGKGKRWKGARNGGRVVSR